MTNTSTDIDIHSLLAERHQIAIIWSAEDVQEIRPDLTLDQAWAVLQIVKKRHDCTIGVSWEVIEFAAQRLFVQPDEFDHDQ